MVKTIQDVVPPATVKHLPRNEVLIATLYIRGVTIEDIFARYYQYDAHRAARDDELFGNDEEGQHGKPKPKPLTVGDAQLAGAIKFLSTQRQPF